MKEFIVDFTGHNDKVTEHTKNHPDNSDGLSYNWNYIQFPLQIGKYYQITKYCDNLPIISFEQWRKNVLDSSDWNIEVETEEQFNEVADFMLLKSYVSSNFCNKFWQNAGNGFNGGARFIKKNDVVYGFTYHPQRSNNYPIEKSISYKEFQQLKNMNKFKVGDFVNDMPLNGVEWSEITAIAGDSFSIIYNNQMLSPFLFSNYPNLKKKEMKINVSDLHMYNNKTTVVNINSEEQWYKLSKHYPNMSSFGKRVNYYIVDISNSGLSEHYDNDKYSIINFEDINFQQMNTEKKIIGYKGLGVIKTKEEWQSFLNRNIENDAEFEKVYEAEFKKGDLVTDDECISVYIYSHKKDTRHYHTKSDLCYFGNKLRQLTKEEIKQYNESITINGYKAVVIDNQICFGYCTQFTKEQLLAYKHFLEINGTAKIIVHNTPITVEILNKLLKKLN